MLLLARRLVPIKSTVEPGRINPRKGFSINGKAKKPFTLIELVGKVVLISPKQIIFSNKGLIGKIFIKAFVFNLFKGL